MFGFLKNILSDEKYVKRNTIIQIVIATISFILLIAVYPGGMVQKHDVSKQQAFTSASRDDLSGEKFTSADKKLQTVFFEKEHLYRIKLYLSASLPDKEAGSQTILFRLYNDEFSCIYEDEYSCEKIAHDGYLKAVPDMDVELGRAYYYEIIADDECSADIWLPVADTTLLSQTENSTLYIDGIINDEVSLIADFDYSSPLSAFEIFLIYIAVIAAAAVIYIAVMLVLGCFDRNFSDRADLFVKCLKIAASVIVAAAALFVIVFSVVLNKFGSPMADRIFYLVAVVAGGLWVEGAIWLTHIYPKTQPYMPAPKRMGVIWRNYIQTVSFGLLFYALCQYVNADREYYHNVNTRWMLIFLAVAFLMMLSESLFLNKYSFIWLCLGWICSALYCRGFKDDENSFMLARLTCGVVVSWGLLIINLLIQIKPAIKHRALNRQKIILYAKKHRQKITYMILWMVFFGLMVKYRFEKVWVFTAVLPFLALFFVKLTPMAKNRFLKNFTNGILLSFGFVTLFCMIHRPHHYWMLYRYGGIFHTVACNGMYLSVVFGAAVGKLYGKIKDRKNIFKRCYFELFITGWVVGFIILTMSRTAFITITVTVISVVILSVITYRKTFKRTIHELAIFAGVIVVSFPMVFTSVRMVPAVINRPIRYEIEFQDPGFMIYRGDPIDSDKYMTVGRFFNVLFGRFQTENETEDEADAGSFGNDLLAYTGNDFAGIDMLTASDEEDETDVETVNDISNGRFKIFAKYFRALRLGGHEKMGPEISDAHAHNSYLQVAYNFGIIAGVIFLAICAMSLWRAGKLVVSHGRKYGIYFVPFALIVVFGFVSLTEWAFHPCIPAGFCFLLLQVILIRE